MRWWFKEHDSMPEPPTRVLQSAFVLWQQEKVNFMDQLGPDYFNQDWKQNMNEGISRLKHTRFYPINIVIILFKMAATGIKMNDKKERKRLGAEWKSLSEEEQVSVECMKAQAQ